MHPPKWYNGKEFLQLSSLFYVSTVPRNATGYGRTSGMQPDLADIFSSAEWQMPPEDFFNISLVLQTINPFEGRP